MDSSDERKKTSLEQPKTSLRKLHRTPKSQPIIEPNMAPAVARVNRVPTSASLSNQDKTNACDDPENVADTSGSFVLGTPGPGSGTGDLSDMMGDEVDYHSYPVGHPKTRAMIEQLQSKIQHTVVMIKEEQNAKSENVNEYLKLSADADRQQAPRIKVVFEKKNQKSTHTIDKLQRKLEEYQKRLKDVETYGTTGHKQAKDVLKDVGQGLKEFFAREPVRSRDGSPIGIRDTSLNSREAMSGTKSKVLKTRFGSADNICSVKPSGHRSVDDRTDKPTLPISGHYQISLKDVSDEEASSVLSDSVPSGEYLSSYPMTQEHLPLIMTEQTEHGLQPSCNQQTDFVKSVSAARSVDLANVLLDLQNRREVQERLQSSFENLKTQWEKECDFYRQALDEERDRCERLEEQINDLSELHQHEVTNIKQELTSMQEKMEYQMEERTRDMQDLLESCQTKITKMELQQQQQQLISMEGIENSNFRALLTKLINVMLALLAVVLVLVSTVSNLIGPFLTTRLRILSTICLIAGLVLTWENWPVILDAIQSLLNKARNFVST